MVRKQCKYVTFRHDTVEVENVADGLPVTEYLKGAVFARLSGIALHKHQRIVALGY